uniref:Uncharacterized protein LOC116954103 isoform X1 n=1 Tax=Petromyzon marinus TaxID=7757 RepID=A0AAJ7U8X8_PETMA|nr:uncharacterized protein LOC116954103 isoform X1 [Petromyzon marinus]XP_032830432.1 uncharacterized protein LOC116954103 isoform X1 [Petromyzon marinus]XP_032830433.1 uncharacterized protein LOC116954103 isoform X1 [Petromyzon marinus]
MKAETNAWDGNCNRITMASSQQQQQQQQQPCGRYVYWSDMETLALLSIIEGMGVVSQLDAKRQRNAHIFEVARMQMARRGFFRPIQQIRYRWKTLKSLYHKQKAAAAAGVQMTFRFMKGMQRLLEPSTVTGPSSPALPLPPLEGPPPTGPLRRPRAPSTDAPAHGSSATASPLAGGGGEEAGKVALQRHLHEDERPQPQPLKEEEEVCPAVKVELLVMEEEEEEEDVEVGIEARQQQQQEENSGTPVCVVYAPGLKEEATPQEAEFAVSVKVELAEEEVDVKARGGAHASARDGFYSTTSSSSQQQRHHRSGRLLRRESTRVRGRDLAATPPPPWEDGLHGGNGKRVRARSGHASASLQQELVLLMREQVALMRQQLLLMRRLERRDERRRSWRTRRGLPPRAGPLCSTPGLPPGRPRGSPGPRGRHGPPDPRTPLAGVAAETSRTDAGGRGVRPAMEGDRAARGSDEKTAAATGKLSV